METASMSLIHTLKEVLSEQQVTENQTIRELHGRDESYHRRAFPILWFFRKQPSRSVKL